MAKKIIKTVLATVIGSTVFYLLGRYVSIPSGVTNTYISIQYGILAFISAVFGPLAGLLTGLIGHFFIDYYSSDQVWWSWVIASSIFGLVMGLAADMFDLDAGRFNRKDIVYFNLSQIISHLAGWLFIAPSLDILFYHEDVKEVYAQGIMCAFVNTIATAVVGTLLCVVYAFIVKAFSKKSGETEENMVA